MLETQEITFDDVLRAGRVLYGPAFAAEAGGWREKLKATYRQRAMETHPDRARSLGRPERELAHEFKAVADAYRILTLLDPGALPRRADARRAPGGGAHAGAPAAAAARPAEPARVRRVVDPGPAAPRAATGGAPRVRVGVRPEDLPRRRLRFAEFLYYSGRVGWTELVEAIAWQRAQRPPVGRIGVELGFLDAADVGFLLERRRDAGATGTPFGEWAVREGFLTPFQLLAVLGRQLRMQRPIGQFFVERGLLDPDDIDLVRVRILRHNARHAP